MKLIAISKGLYRNRTGSVVVSDDKVLRPIGGRWTVRWSDFSGAKQTRNFETLADARRFLTATHY